MVLKEKKEKKIKMIPVENMNDQPMLWNPLFCLR